MQYSAENRVRNASSNGCYTLSITNKILIIDDDEAFREELIEQFALHGEFLIQAASNATDGVAHVKSEQIDMVILDVGLPDMDGREVCKLMRRNGFKAPIIMLAAMDSEADTILGLDAGADDYVSKPFRFAVLLARIRAHLRQHEQSKVVEFTVGRFLVRPNINSLICEDHSRIKLTEKESAILTYLYRAEQNIVSRDVLLREIWGYRLSVTTHTLETHIYRLRQKIELDPSHPEFLLTERGGYKLDL